MIDIIPQSESRRLAFAVSGGLSEKDYDQLRPEMDLRADKYDGFDLLVELRDIDGIEPSVLREELSFTKDYADSIDHMAVVAESSGWSSLAEFVGKPFGSLIGVDVEQFDDVDVASEWLDSQHS